jgi:GTPase SAR1 family protein
MNDQEEIANTASTPSEMKLPPVVDRIQNQTAEHPAPICVLVVGMAGSGKTTLISALQQSTIVEDLTTLQDDSLEQKPEAVDSQPRQMPAYCINLDPATLDVPYSPSIDIRDTVDYKQVMQQHHLGPNGAIMTSLNLYATKFDQVIHILEQRADQQELSEFLLVDTPGQIEAFTWSASGNILSESLASTFPTVLVFVVDTVRCASSPNTFMSNMLYACSIYYRTRLPLVIAFNKTDVVSHEFCMEWMKDFEAFQEALDSARQNTDGSGESGFYDSLTRSLSLVLDEFYTEFSKNAVGVSAVTGDGMDDFWSVVRQAASTDFQEYIDDLKHRIQEQDAKRKAIARAQARRLEKDIQMEAPSK